MAAADYTSLVQSIYVSYFGRPADTFGLNNFAAQLDALKAPTTARGLAEAYKTNASLRSLIDGFGVSAESTALYGSSSADTVAFVSAIYTNLLNRAPDFDGLVYWTLEINAGRLTRANASLAIMAGATDNASAQGLLDAKVVANKVAVANVFTTNIDTGAELAAYTGNAAAAAARGLLAQVTATTDPVAFTATVNAAITAIVSGSVPVTTTSLTTGVDAIVGGNGNDIINANPGASNANTFTALDNIDGGVGTDTLNVTEIGAAGPAAYTLNSAATVKNVEVLNYTVASDDAGDTLGADVSAWAGLTTANFVIAGTDTAASITTKGNVTSASVTGSTTAAISDAATTDTLASVTATAATGLVTVTSDALTSLNLVGSTGGAAVVAAAGTRVLTVGLNNVTAGTVTDAEATGLVINTSGAKSTGATVSAAKAEAVTINADEALTLASLATNVATSLTVTGDSKVTLTAATIGALTSINASAQTAGGIDTSAFALAAGVAVTGGAGADSIQIGATTKAITLGAGDDRVLLTATTSALGTDGSVDAGEGSNDTLAFADADDATTATGGAAFEATVAGFETIELAGAAGAAVTVNLANLDDAKNVIVSADLVTALTVSNAVSGSTVTYSATQTSGSTIGVANASTGTADVVNVAVKGAAAVTTGSLTIADVETINYLTDDTATTPTGIAHVSTLVAAAAKTITVAGDAGLTLTNTNTTITSFDASGVTKGAVVWTTGALAAAATIKGGAGANTIDFAAATKAVTYTGGAGVDTVIANGSNNTISTAAGNDIVTLGSGANTVDLGAGDDDITLGGGLNVVTGGAGTDDFILTGVVVTNGNTYSTINDFTVGETIAFTDAGLYAGSATLGAKITLAATAAFADFLQAATAGVTAGEVEWFQFGGDTYVVNDASATAAYVNGTDQIVKLVGLVDLSASTTSAAGVVTFVIA